MIERILITGGREFANPIAIRRGLILAIGHFRLVPNDTIFIHGGARGVDNIAADQLQGMGYWTAKVRPLWAAHGSVTAAPRRNIAMLMLLPTACIAFPGGNGTAHMVQHARAARVPVFQVDEEGRLQIPEGP